MNKFHFHVTVSADTRVDPEVVKRNLEAYLSLMSVPANTVTTSGDVEDGKIRGYNVEFTAVPNDCDGPFKTFQIDNDGVPTNEGDTFESGVEALAEAFHHERDGIHASVFDREDNLVYVTAG